MRALLFGLGILTLAGCASKGPQSGPDGIIFDQFGRADFAEVTSRRAFVDYVYTHMAEMDGVDQATKLCLGRQYETHMTSRYWQAVDRFVVDHSPQNWADVVHVHNSERSPYDAQAAEADVKACM